ncbi:MAG: hypothetical protein R2754_15940 [Microthrixaceae bacterium]
MAADEPTAAEPTAAAPAPSAWQRQIPSLASSGVVNDRWRLILLSFLMLFVELALIRWAGSNIIYLSYFSNFVLLGSFLGIGIGFLRARRRLDLSGAAPVVLALFVLLVAVFPVNISQDDPSVFFFSTLTPKGPPRELVLAAVFFFSAAVLAFIAEGVARTFARFEPLEAYKWDLVGSVAGIVGFSLLSFLRLSPVVWGLIAGVMLVALMLPRWPSVAQLTSVAVLVMVLAVESFTAGNLWSPYYKVSYAETDANNDNLFVKVNGVPHQAHLPGESAQGKNIYLTAQPPTLDNVLVIGSGGGNDVALALQKGAKHVDAVEIDPVLYELGRDHHPDRPYSDPRVDVHIDDGRAFLERSDTNYDLILLALPDSITLISGQSSLRLESYLFTKEALETARDRLTDDGVFAMFNYYRNDWLIDRYGTTLDDVYGQPPCFQELAPGLGEEDISLDAFVASKNPESIKCGPPAAAETWTAQTASAPEPATDDHPYPYLRTRSLPSLYAIILALILAVSILAIRATAGPLKPMLRYGDMFFMGVAFLLLETKNVVQFALLFGTTWFVNALVFSGVLLSVLVAVAVSQRVTFKRPELLYGLLLASLVVAWALPGNLLLSLPIVPRFFAAVTIAFFPIFTANLVFTQRFKDTGDSTTAFGANLLGAMFGGVLEYLALITGYRALLIIVALLYGAAFFMGRRYLGGSDGAGSAGAATGAASG